MRSFRTKIKRYRVGVSRLSDRPPQPDDSRLDLTHRLAPSRRLVRTERPDPRDPHTLSNPHSTDREWRTGGTPELHAARNAAEEYLLERRLLYRLFTGERHVWAHHLGYPFRFRFSALRALDHFRAAAQHDGDEPDPRLAEAIEKVRSSRDADGTWHQAYPLEGRQWFAVDVPAGEPSRWLTFFALRVLRWWDATSRDRASLA